MSFLFILLVITTVLFLGLPVLFLTKLLNYNKKYYLLAPFLGISLIVLFCQTLFYLDVSLAYSTWILWSIGVFAWLVAIITKKCELPTKKVLMVFLIGLMALIISGWGYFVSGYEECHGECWIDQYNYVSQSQFMIDYKYSTGFSEITGDSYAIQGVIKKEFNIGQDMLNAFMAVTTFTETKNFFAPFMILVPLLICFAIFLLSNELFDYKISLALALIAGIFPVLTKLHLESFFAQMQMIPFLILFPYLYYLVIKKRKWIYLVLLAVFMNVVINMYYYFIAILVGLLCVVVISTFLIRKEIDNKSLKKIFLFLLLFPLILFLLNPIYLIKMPLKFNYLAKENVLGHIYPFAFTKQMIPTLFFGDMITMYFKEGALGNWGGKLNWFFNIISYLLLFFAIFGWGTIVKKSKAYNKIVVYSCVSLMLLPVLTYANPKSYPYEFFKLAITFSPLIAIGAGYGLYLICKSFIENKWFFRFCYMIIVVMFVIGDFALIYPTTNPESTLLITASTKANVYKKKEFKYARKKLSLMENQNIVIDAKDHIINGWLGYFARKNNLWFLHDKVGGSRLATSKGNRGYNFVDLKSVPADALLYDYDNMTFSKFDLEKAEDIRVRKGYTIVE